MYWYGSKKMSVVHFGTKTEGLTNAFQFSPKLIVSTGDVSDVDGFYALAAYAKTGADVLFVMNYPAYLKSPDGTPQLPPPKPGLGFIYSADQIPAMNGEEFTSNEDAWQKLTDYAFNICKRVWEEQGPAGKLYFQIGGVNEVNPFATKSIFGGIKNEPGVYKSLFPPGSLRKVQLLAADEEGHKEGHIFFVDGSNSAKSSGWSLRYLFSKYKDIYIDFNGSMAFFNDEWKKVADAFSAKIRGVFVMGGVYADGNATLTLSAIPSFLNRFSCCTMNQLYAPQRTAAFFRFCSDRTIPTYVVTNNVVPELKDNKAPKDLTPMRNFLATNGLVSGDVVSGDKSFLWQAAELYYNNGTYDAPRKPFDFYTAAALCSFLKDSNLPFTDKTLFYDDTYGVSLVAEDGKTPKEALALHVTGLKVKEDATSNILMKYDVPILKAALPEFQKESIFFSEGDFGFADKLTGVVVRNLTFDADLSTPLHAV